MRGRTKERKSHKYESTHIYTVLSAELDYSLRQHGWPKYCILALFLEKDGSTISYFRLFYCFIKNNKTMPYCNTIMKPLTIDLLAIALSSRYFYPTRPTVNGHTFLHSSCLEFSIYHLLTAAPLRQ